MFISKILILWSSFFKITMAFKNLALCKGLQNWGYSYRMLAKIKIKLSKDIPRTGNIWVRSGFSLRPNMFHGYEDNKVVVFAKSLYSSHAVSPQFIALRMLLFWKHIEYWLQKYLTILWSRQFTMQNQNNFQKVKRKWKKKLIMSAIVKNSIDWICSDC